MATATVNIFFDIFNGMIPLVFIFGDTFLQIGDGNRYTQLGVTACKFISVLLFVIYLSYLYYNKGEIRRDVNNYTDLIMYLIMMVLLMSTLIMIIYKIKKDKDEGNLKNLI